MSDLTREDIERALRDVLPGGLVQVPANKLRALCTMALRALDAGWQPMSTAPRDGTPILVSTTTIGYGGHKIVCIGCVREDEYGDEEDAYIQDEDGFPLDHDPVAWMPLPPPCAEVPHE